jgi:hypothetical protein
VWLVPSQSRIGKKYKVVVTDKEKKCNCADFKANGKCKCKHIHAVEQKILRVEYPDPGFVDPVPAPQPTKKKPTYPQDWRNYNAAQTTEKPNFMEMLAGLCEFVDDEEAIGPGRPCIPKPDLAYAMIYKVYERNSTRRFISDAEIACRFGYIDRVPHFNSIINGMNDEWMTEQLRKLIKISSLPFRGLERTFAADSSGFAASPYQRWQEIKPTAKDGDIPNAKKKSDSVEDQEVIERARQTWAKVHLMCGVSSHIVTAAVIKGKDAADTKQLPELIHETIDNFSIKQVCADKAYGSIDNYQVMADLSIDPFIPFKKNQSGAGKGRSGQQHKTSGGKLWKEKFLQFQLHSEEFETLYHQRSNVETVFSMIKSKFGSDVRSKTERGMLNEVLCKIICHNICCIHHAAFELGLVADELRPTRSRGWNPQVIDGGRGTLQPA